MIQPASTGRNWSPQEDIESLGQWEDLFGDNFRGLFVFGYHVLGDRSPLPPGQCFEYRQRLYAFVAVRLDDYAVWSRPVSNRWDTVAMPAAVFRRMAQPVEELLDVGAAKTSTPSE